MAATARFRYHGGIIERTETAKGPKYAVVTPGKDATETEEAAPEVVTPADSREAAREQIDRKG